MNNKYNLFGITGWKNSGKTHMVASLVEEFTSRGLKVSTIKHAHHAFDIDHVNTDTWKHRKAGAGEVAIVSNNRWALMHELKNEQEPSLEEIAKKLTPCDLILVEGYKLEKHPKLETIRPPTKGTTDNKPLWSSNESILAIAADHKIENCTLPIFSQENTALIADFILAALNKEKQNAAE